MQNAKVSAMKPVHKFALIYSDSIYFSYLGTLKEG